MAYYWKELQPRMSSFESWLFLSALNLPHLPLNGTRTLDLQIKLITIQPFCQKAIWLDKVVVLIKCLSKILMQHKHGQNYIHLTIWPILLLFKSNIGLISAIKKGLWKLVKSIIGSKQCNQIGRFLKVLYNKELKYFVSFCMILRSITFRVKLFGPLMHKYGLLCVSFLVTLHPN